MSSETLEFVRREIKSLHGLYNNVMQDIDDAQFNQVPAGGNQNIAFCLWHYVRTEDNIVQFIFQRQPTVWMTGGWDQKFGLDSKAQGTGFTDDEARSFRIGSVSDFKSYMSDVWKSTEAYLGQLAPEDLARNVTVRPLGEMPALRCLSDMVMTHGYRHLGEIEFAKGLTGKRGSSSGI